ncbi:putative vasopressin-like neuropeptide preprohormone [Daphnia pulex]|uniref:Putative vasopressin-like neuropeptide preprohormone n=1 Tax=Daphnia pulex TaxID=6669 RepID=E9H8T6_DAPPU|nr:putative vasopressin-like neuropeptide preprohormone [Daphnia pulex]|eukprot:EFX71881.1 putative vasopressin-like neuropeptide preprohormone [Daphnia pulex]
MAGLWTFCLIALSMTEMIIPLTAKPCFITNCPPGGKRSSQLVEPSSYLECAPCGPAGKGTCLGANLCCGSHFGCFFKTEETNVCLLTNLKSTQICNQHFWKTDLKSASCSLNGDKIDGICVADLLCCSLGNLPQDDL